MSGWKSRSSQFLLVSWHQNGFNNVPSWMWGGVMGLLWLSPALRVSVSQLWLCALNTKQDIHPTLRLWERDPSNTDLLVAAVLEACLTHSAWFLHISPSCPVSPPSQVFLPCFLILTRPNFFGLILNALQSYHILGLPLSFKHSVKFQVSFLSLGAHLWTIQCGSHCPSVQLNVGTLSNSLGNQ